MTRIFQYSNDVFCPLQRLQWYVQSCMYNHIPLNLNNVQGISLNNIYNKHARADSVIHRHPSCKQQQTRIQEHLVPQSTVQLASSPPANIRMSIQQLL